MICFSSFSLFFYTFYLCQISTLKYTATVTTDDKTTNITVPVIAYEISFTQIFHAKELTTWGWIVLFDVAYTYFVDGLK